jgi:hypothetical protein
MMNAPLRRGPWVALLLLTTPFAQPGELSVSKQALMTFEGTVRIAAPAATVWKAVTDADKAVSWCPLWKNAESAEALTQLGASVDFLDQWENPGRSVVVYVDAERGSPVTWRISGSWRRSCSGGIRSARRPQPPAPPRYPTLRSRSSSSGLNT